jgi:menaquinol-cytochrome c reductase iron-sulfur subunit
MLHRRDFYRIGSYVLGAAMGLILAVPGAAFVLDPLRRRGKTKGVEQEVTRLSALPVGVPFEFAIIDERDDAWVKYPREAIGSVWLVRQPKGVKPEVVALTAECPHLGCAIRVSDDKRAFRCPCHGATFALDGQPTNAVPPRAMDTLRISLTDEVDPRVLVHFERFRAQTKEKTPLV